MTFAVAVWTLPHTVASALVAAVGVGCGVAALLGLTLFIGRNASAALRCRLATAALWSALLAPLAAGAVVALAFEAKYTAAGILHRLQSTSESAVGWIVASWLVGVAFCWIWLAMGWRRLTPLRNAAGPVRELNGTPVRIVDDALLAGPAVVGWRRPAVLAPAWCFERLSETSLGLLLTHERAHLERHDFANNLMERIAASLLWFHPAVWWMVGCIHRERERRCDDAVLAAGADRLAYARALAALATSRPAPISLALGANGELAGRIRRLLEEPEGPTAGTWRGVVGNTLVAAVLAVGVVQAYPARLPPTDTPDSLAGCDSPPPPAPREFCCPCNP